MARLSSLTKSGMRNTPSRGWLRVSPAATLNRGARLAVTLLVKDIVTDPVRDTLLMRVSFTTPQPEPDLKLYLFAEPQMGDRGADNDAWVGQYKSVTMLLSQRGRTCLAVASEPPMLQTSCGYMGSSDGYTALSKFDDLPGRELRPQRQCRLDRRDRLEDFRRKLHDFARLRCRPGMRLRSKPGAGILEIREKTWTSFEKLWKEQQEEYADIEDLSGHTLDMYRVSTAVLETHQSKRFPGAFVASLSLPWGFDRSDADIGGYHVLWPRDMVETAMGKLASGDARSARSTLFYLSCTQDGNGGWSQNMWLDGTMHWGAIQMDGMALPILLADKIRQENALDGYDPGPMVHGAASFLLKNGPVSQQGRWEATSGYSIYTVATEIAALLAAADFAEAASEITKASFLRDTADAWYDAIDELTYAKDTSLAKEHGVSGYYMRVAPPKTIERKEVGSLMIKMPNLPFGSKHQLAVNIVSPDALALVRYGLRSADDPRILATIKVIDATLKRETKTGPVWVRSSKDGYGEHADGSPFDKTGIGRGMAFACG